MDNPMSSRCFEIIAIPNYREKGPYLISKEDVLGIRDIKALLKLLSQPDDSKIASMTANRVLDYLPLSLAKILYCFGVNTSDMSFVGLFDHEDSMIKSQPHSATNPDVGITEGINVSQSFLGGVNSFSEIHLENFLLAALSLGIIRLHPNSLSPSHPKITIFPILKFG
ncbi:hypothetical protein QAD02_011664 [Eretmocerus hayati]|uniref:Uncharacterized protein n=1 Tax=Eretmocerus hayati TaxID=131215 RepID=A0ACC2NXD7_9HYME|nr:hypothetical protein QAD02_011664 [Eretmocerus hayati]